MILPDQIQKFILIYTFWSVTFNRIRVNSLKLAKPV